MEQKIDNQTSKLLKQFNEDPLTKRLVDKYCAPIIYDDAFGICHLEAMHTNFLKWLVEKSGEVSPSLLYHLIEIICNKGKELPQQDIKDKIAKIKSVLSSNIRLREIKKEYTTSYRDKCANKQRYPKVDLVIDLIVFHKHEEIPLKIIIENKVYSREHDNQTEIYYAYFSGDDNYIKNKYPEISFYKNNIKKKNERVYKKLINELQLFVFLHPINYNLISHAGELCNMFIPVSYQDLFELLHKENNFSDEDKNIIKEYKHILVRPVKTYKIYKAMVKDPKESANLKRFGKKYLPLFKLAVEEMRNSEDDDLIDGETSAALDQIIDAIDQFSGKRVKYDLFINEKSLTNLKMREVADHIVKYLYIDRNKSIKEINELLPNNWICDIKEYKEKKYASKQSSKRFDQRWDKIGQLYVSSEWTKDKFDGFILRLENEFPEINIKQTI